MNENIRYIFVTGGVVSSIGKGIVAASLGTLMKARGLRVTIQKLDPYINVDAGTMNPYQHGEVYVTDDGAETDLDLGHYERYIDESLGKSNNITTGKVYGAVIEKERRGDYLGDTVRVIPHITDEIKRSVLKVSEDTDVAIVEVGGTVGDIEGLPFLEAIRQFKYDVGPERVLYVHVTLVPHIGAAGELKTKPTQHSVKELRAIGIQPDVIICRTEKNLSDDMIGKISLYTDVPKDSVFASRDVQSIYEVPMRLEKQGLGDLVVRRLGLTAAAPDLETWKNMVKKLKKPPETVRISVVGKYIELKDAYLSIVESIQHGAIANDIGVEIIRVDASHLEEGREEAVAALKSSHGILVPGGFGARGIEGKIMAIQYARENKVPYLGICYGMQWAVVEFARNVLGWADAHSTEVDPQTSHPVVFEMKEQKNQKQLGGTMRLGAYTCRLRKKTRSWSAYQAQEVQERHRHRFEFNNKFRTELEDAGLVISGENPERYLVEIVELKDHPWFVACQFHPEFRSRPLRAHPLFREFVAAALQISRTQSIPNLLDSVVRDHVSVEV